MSLRDWELSNYELRGDNYPVGVETMSDFGDILEGKCMNFSVRIVNLCRFLTEENELFTALVSNCVNAGTMDFSSIIDGTNEVCQQLIKSLTECGTPSVQVMTLMYVRSNHRLIQNAVCGLSVLSGSDNLTAEHSDLCISLLLSPFICVNRQLVCARTAEQVAEIRQISRSIPIVLEKCYSNSGFEGIYLNDMPLSIIKKIITDDID